MFLWCGASKVKPFSLCTADIFSSLPSPPNPVHCPAAMSAGPREQFWLQIPVIHGWMMIWVLGVTWLRAGRCHQQLHRLLLLSSDQLWLSSWLLNVEVSQHRGTSGAARLQADGPYRVISGCLRWKQRSSWMAVLIPGVKFVGKCGWNQRYSRAW